ncbi:MAG: LacI family transcriptional regulator [Clostridiales bacterium]|nr:LacI family transcriptional regulator [Clostridiales bacterium]
MMNIYVVAKRAGVSIATVSRVINNSGSVKPVTRQKVEAAIKELNYRPNAIARSLVVNATQTIGVLASDVRDSYHAAAIAVLEQEFRKYGYHVILCNTGGEREKRTRYLGLLLEKKVDGMVLVGSIFKEKDSNAHILEASDTVPIVMLNSHLEGKNIFSVVCDDTEAVSKVVESLVENGHKKIAYVYDVDSFSGLAKLEGYKAGMKNAGLEIQPGWILKTANGLEGGKAAAEKLMGNHGDLTAVIASEDILAAGVLKGLAAKGIRVPHDMSVFGYNNSVIARCTTPELSSVDNKVDVLAREAASMLYQVLQGNEVPHLNTVIARLVFRESGPVPCIYK